MNFIKERLSMFLLCFLGMQFILNAQVETASIQFKTLDVTYFKWKAFSFNQSWGKTSNVCGFQKALFHPRKEVFYAFDMPDDSTKIYYTQNPLYKELNGVKFDQTILVMKGDKFFANKRNNLYLFKYFTDSLKAFQEYDKVLTKFRAAYGNAYSIRITKHEENIDNIDFTTYLFRDLNRNKKEFIDTLIKNTYFLDINNLEKINLLEETKWIGKNIVIELRFIGTITGLFMYVDIQSNFEGFPKSIPPVNLFFQSEYNERYKFEFKEFDKNNRYKNLLFGTSFEEIKKSISLGDIDSRGRAYASEFRYKNWLGVLFESCKLGFNKRKLLQDVSLYSEKISISQWEGLIEELTQLFGQPIRDNSENKEEAILIWKGKKLAVYASYISKDKAAYISISNLDLNDWSPVDKLYY